MKSLFHMLLDESELFIAFIFKNFGEQGHLMIIFKIDFDRMDNSWSPLNDQGLETILLVKIGVHKLFHSFDWQATFPAFLIILDFLIFHVTNHVFKLLKREYFMSEILNTLHSIQILTAKNGLVIALLNVRLKVILILT